MTSQAAIFCISRFINRTFDSLDTFAESCCLENNIRYPIYKRGFCKAGGRNSEF